MKQEIKKTMKFNLSEDGENFNRVVEKLLANVKNASIQQLEADKISYQNQLKEVENQGESKTE